MTDKKIDLQSIVQKKTESLKNALESIEEAGRSDRSRFLFVEALSRAVQITLDALRSGKKIIAAGNGGSAAEAQHLSGEIVGRFRGDKPPLPALCLHGDTSSLTAIANDFGYESVFSRQIRAFGEKGDVLFLLSTSGRSKNLLEAAGAARSLGISSIAMLGRRGGDLADLCDVVIPAPSEDPQTVQEMHLFAIHCIAWAVEEAFAESGTL